MRPDESRWPAVFADSPRAWLLHAAMHDSLTNLPNRRLLKDRLDTALARSRRSGSGQTVAVLFIDLDDFKRVNDDLGHDAGDELLVAVARNILSALRSCDTVARQGGDEFVVVCEDVTAEGDVSRLVRRLREAIRRPVLLRGRQVSVEASVGVAVPGHSAVTSQELVRLADLAMYRAKARRNVDFVMAEDSLAAATGRAPCDKLVSELRHAVQADQLVLHYQPVVRFDGSLLGLEALVRWPHPRLGLLLPGEFLHVAEGTELGKPVSDWVLRTAISDAASWCDPTVRVSVNVWATEAGQPGFASTVTELLTWAGLPGRGLYLEMRESDLAAGGPALADELEQLCRLGVGLAVDDFGTGGSSLTDLRTLPVGALKIDRTFVAASDDPAEAALVGAVGAAARALGRHAVAAGVETPEQLRRVKGMGYRSVQGFLTGPPAPLVDLRDVVRDRRVTIPQS
ncbi:MAG: putative bifunctional diguanylate cyclase/phosphodiesterase [Actinomycetes bacterium]